MTAKTNKPLDRNKLISQVHLGTSRLFGRHDDEAHSQYLFHHTGKASCTQLTDLELDYLAKQLRKAGALDGDGNTVGGEGAGRPTKDQWRKLAALSRQKGWGGLESKDLQAFIGKTAKVTNSRFLTREGITKVITGLEKWIKEEQEKGHVHVMPDPERQGRVFKRMVDKDAHVQVDGYAYSDPALRDHVHTVIGLQWFGDALMAILGDGEKQVTLTKV